MWAKWSNGGLNDLKKKAIFIVEMYLFCVQKGVKYNTNKINHNRKHWHQLSRQTVILNIAIGPEIPNQCIPRFTQVRAVAHEKLEIQ